MSENIILGEGCCYSSDSSITQLNNNILVIGASGSGKTMSITEPRLLETKESSLIVNLSKQKLAEKYMPLYRARGYNNIHVINFANPSLSQSGYDPIRYLHNDTDIREFAESIIMSDPRKEQSHADPYWDHGSTSLLTAEIAAIKETKRNPSFTDVLDLHNQLEIIDGTGGLIQTSLDEFFERISTKNPKSIASSCWRSFRMLPIKTASCVFSSLNVMLDAIFPPDMWTLMKKNNQVDIRRIGVERSIIFLISSPVNTGLHQFENLFFDQVIKELFSFAEECVDGTLPVPVIIQCDDFACGSKLRNFPEFISVIREKGISVVLIIQSESQLISMYGTDDATTIRNNCDTIIFLGSLDLHTCKTMSEYTNRPLEDILYMDIGTEIILRRGQRPIFTKRYPILEDKRYFTGTESYENCNELPT